MKKEDFFGNDISKLFPEEYQIFFQNLSGTPFSVPHGTDIAGPINYGSLAETSEKAGLFPEELNQHLLVAGRSGSGKTNLLRILFLQLLNSYPCWFIDFKQDYRHFLNFTKDLLVFRWKDFKFNPLRPPPGTDPLKWIQIFSDVFCLSFSLLAASKNLLLEVIHELCNLYGVFNGSGTYPSVIGLHEMLGRKERQKGLSFDQKGYIARTRNKTSGLSLLHKGIFDCDQGYRLEDLVCKNVVFELDGLTDEIQTLITSLILAWLITYRMDRGERGRMRQIVAFDEARKVFKKDYKSDFGTPYLEQMMAQIREFGVGFVLADQMPHALPDAVKSNVCATICLSLSNGKDIEDIARTMRLTKEQADFLGKLPVGQGIVKLADRWPEAFHIAIPYLPLERFVTDEEIERHMKQHIGNELKEKKGTPLSEVLAKADTKSPSPKPEMRPDDFKVRVNEVKRTKTSQARDFLIHIEKYPDLNVTERYMALGLSGYRGNRIQKELLEKGYIVEVRKGKAVYLELTEKGRASIGSPQQKMAGKGSTEHKTYQMKIQKYYEDLGYNAYIEKDLDGKSIDVLVNKAGRLIAIEIELNITDHIIDNVSKDFTVGVHEVVIVTKRELIGKIKEKVEKALGEADIKYLTFEVIDNFIK